MDIPDTANTDTERLSRIMALSDRPEDLWSDADLAAIFKHQLSVTIVDALVNIGVDARKALDAQGLAEVPLSLTFGQLLQDPQADAKLLDLAKRYAKASSHHLEYPLPAHVAKALYFLCIAAAIVHRGKRITALDAGALSNGLEWAANLPWIDETTRALLAKCLESQQK